MRDIEFVDTPQNPVELEAILGVPRGAVSEMTFRRGQVVKIKIDETRIPWPDPVTRAKVEKAMGRTVR